LKVFAYYEDLSAPLGVINKTQMRGREKKGKLMIDKSYKY